MDANSIARYQEASRRFIRKIRIACGDPSQGIGKPMSLVAY
jgi:hypothetical protein